MSKRLNKVDELIKQNLSKVVVDFLPDEIVSIADVETSPDLSFAKIYLNVLGDKEDVPQKLNKQSSDIRSELMKKIVLKRTPKLKFVLNLSEAHVEKIEELLDEARKK